MINSRHFKKVDAFKNKKYIKNIGNNDDTL